MSRNVLRQSFVGGFLTHGNPSGAGSNTLAGIDARFATSAFRGGENLSLDLYAFVTDDEASGRKGHAWGGKLDYPNDLWDVALSFKEIDADFRPALGFVSRTGIRKANAKADFMPRPGRAGIRQLFFEASTQYVSDLDGRTLDWMVVASPLGFETESGDGLRLEWVPQFERLDEPFEIQDGILIPAGDYHYTAWIVEVETAERRRWVRGPRGALGELLRRGPDPARGRARAQAQPAPAARGRGRVEPGLAARGRLHDPGLRGAVRAELQPEPRLVEPRAVRLGLPRAGLPEPAALAGEARQRRVRRFNRGWVREEDGSYRGYFDRGSAKVQHTFRW